MANIAMTRPHGTN